MNGVSRIVIGLVIALGLFPPLASAASRGKTATVNGFVLDSACAFVKDLKKPVNPDCAVACAKAGSPMVILSESGVLYWPISGDMPAKSQNDRLLPFAGKYVSVHGEVLEKGGSHGIVISSIKESASHH
jgi:hypothetical protein